jgi:hypothetical protein
MKTINRTPQSPTINRAEVAWAANEIVTILRQTDPDSIVGAVLEQTLNELNSLKSSTESTVVGPFRMKAA